MTEERPTFDPRGRALVYVAIADVLEGRITDGTYPPDSRLPSEPALTAEFGCARDTIRAAVRELRGRGLVETVPGTGTYVIPAGERQLAPVLASRRAE